MRQTSAALAEAIAGPRPQEIEAARAALASAEATLALAETEPLHTKLVSPATGTVMTRVIEPGTVVLPAASIYAVAITDEVWVRTFAPEPMLARVAPGTQVTVTTDAPGGKDLSRPNRLRVACGRIHPEDVGRRRNCAPSSSTACASASRTRTPPCARACR